MIGKDREHVDIISKNPGVGFHHAQEMAEGKVYRWPGAQPRIPTEQQMMEGQLLGCHGLVDQKLWISLTLPQSP